MPCCWTAARQAPLSMGLPRQEYGVGAISLCTDTHLEDIFSWFIVLMQEGGDPFHGLRAGSCLTLGNELSEEMCTIKARGFIGKGCRDGGQEGEGSWENCSAMWLTVSGFMGTGLVSGLSLASHSELGSFLVAYASLIQGGFCKEDPGRLVRPADWSLLSPLTFPEFWLVVAS